MHRFYCKRLWSSHLLQHSFPKFLATSSSKPPSPLIIRYLINVCELPPKTAPAVAQKLHLQRADMKQFDAVLDLLSSVGFSKDQIKTLITRQPKLLLMRAETNIKPKVQFLREMGYSTSDISDIIVSCPSIMSRSLDNYLMPLFEVLKEFLGNNAEVKLAIRRGGRFLQYDLKQTLLPNAALLLDEGIPTKCVPKLVVNYPKVILQKHSDFVKLVQWGKGMGIPPLSSTFTLAIVAKFVTSNETWNRKVKMFMCLGWSEEEVMTTFRKAPFFFLRSEEKVSKVAEFVVNKMKLDSKELCKYPVLFMYGLEKRIIPRFTIIEVLKSKELITRDKKFLSAFCLPEKNFLDRFVTKYVDRIPDLMELYQQQVSLGSKS
ncbi:transcription termination factor MTERF9, chloroplastic-like [Aristolochia californica]|uniref:transcription termination factor MTERF9, chloroplastic-like n=1 Tax=Aristolochia californica TaxID=171875 RepID=UPI0035DDED9E